MNTAEIAEAIIVVGPYLWKCVNCDLLYSRQHSIDDHILSEHKSPLLQDRPTNVKCKLSVCSCQKLPGVIVDKKAHRVNKNKRKSSDGDTLSEEEELYRSSAYQKSPGLLADKSSSKCDDKNDLIENVMNQCESNPSETDDNHTSCPLEEEEENYMEVRTLGNRRNEEEQTYSETESHDHDESKNKTDCERQSSEDIICHKKEQFSLSSSDSADTAMRKDCSENNGHTFLRKDFPEDRVQTFLRKDDHEESVPDSPRKDDFEESAQASVRKNVAEEMGERGMKRLFTGQENQSTRKSRRSNKGKNSLYQEFEMGFSKNV